MQTDAASAVVLSGGGAHAAYGVGVMSALCGGLSPATGGRPLQAQIFAGTSMGAYNATFMASRPRAAAAAAVAELKDLWLHRITARRNRYRNGVFRLRGNPLELLNPLSFARAPWRRLAEMAEDAGVFGRRALQAGVNIVRSREPLYHRFLDELDLGVFFSTEPFERLLAETVDVEALRWAGNRLRIVAVSWGEAGFHVFKEHHLWEGLGTRPILASAALPGLSPPVEIEGELFIDGGVLDNAPVWEAYRAGADEIYVVDTYPHLERLSEVYKPSQLHAIYRTMSAIWLADLERDLGNGSIFNRLIDKLPAQGEGDRLLNLVHRLIELEDPGERPSVPITIHRFRPSINLRALGWLDFQHDDVAGTIDCGIRDAIEHDCHALGCILPGGQIQRRRRRTVGTGTRNEPR